MASNSTASTSPLVVSSPSPTASSSLPTPESSTAPSVDPSSEPSATPTPTPTPSPSDTEPTSSVATPSSEPPSSTPVVIPSSSTPPPAASSTPGRSSAPAQSSTPAATSIVTASSQPPSTIVFTSLVTPSATVPGETPSPSVVVITIHNSDTSQATDGTLSQSTLSTGTAGATLQDPEAAKAEKGLSTGGKTAIAVVIPVVVVAILVLAGIVLWRRRKQKKIAEEARRKEVEEYGFNPNNDPTLPAVGMQTEMTEDQSGYRGWGNTTTSSNRKASTTLNSGMTYSDSNSNPGGPGSPTQGTYSDGHSGDPLVNGKRETLDSDGIGALGAAPNAGQNQGGVNRGPSNASSSYSAADRSDNSGDYPIPVNNPQEYYENGYYQSNPYDNGYGGGQQPVIRDVSARRNTRIENPSVFPQQGNSGIAQNF